MRVKKHKTCNSLTQIVRQYDYNIGLVCLMGAVDFTAENSYQQIYCHRSTKAERHDDCAAKCYMDSAETLTKRAHLCNMFFQGQN